MKLLIDLAKDGIYGCGTLRSNRSGFPADLVPHLKKGRAHRGTRQCNGDGWLTNRKQDCQYPCGKSYYYINQL